ncbi:CHASE3 domain-containing protein [Flavobacterium sp. SUN052]|uniref:sensor histidine kinase n=1 Tax=Flavobacterium sp. SUN052 TaxID=3002441 RepID=UPI00237DFCCB|nr:CHASE3 domain-containing protein [Flavobacterium sp. SUN052]MEC4005723.1 CHASE3 domain-containing protein [Flavobacterium sp. SUN052]
MKINSLYNSPIFLKVVFVLSVFIIFFISAITFKHLTSIRNTSAYVERSYKVSLELERVISYIKDAETGQRGFLLTKDSTYLKPYYESRIKIDRAFNNLTQLTSDNPKQQQNIDKLKLLINKRKNYLSKNIYLVLNSNLRREEFLHNLKIGKITMDSIRDHINDMDKIEDHLFKTRTADYESTMKFTPIIIYITLLVTLFLIFISFVKINKDLKRLKTSNAKLLIANESTRMSEIVGSFGSWQYDMGNDKYFFSDNEYRLLGCEPNSFEPTLDNFLKYVHPEDVNYVQENVNKMIENENLPSFTYRVITKNGEQKYLSGIARLLKDRMGSKILIGVTIDVTQEYLATQLIEDRNTELEANNKELSAFNYVASHDLQEPLRKIQTFISRIAEKEADNFSDSGKDYMDRIQNAINRMRLLIDDLLQFSRTNKTEKVFETVDLSILLENSKQELSQSIEDKKAIITNDALPVSKVIPFQIQQLFTNLINNSLKYSKANVSPVININYEKISGENEEFIPIKNKTKYHKITFKDNGIGFEQEYSEKIFELFGRLHNKNEYSGTGIGLAICKKIVENHKGYIYAKGEPNNGATFIIYLPVI